MLDLHNIQGIVTRGYRMPHAAYYFVNLVDRAAAQAWIGALTDSVTFGEHWEHKPNACLNIGFSFEGLRALGAPQDSLGSFPEEFRQGPVRRASLVGDVGHSAPERWEGGLEHGVHACVILHAISRDLLDGQFDAVWAMPGRADGVAEISHLHAAAFDGDREHFGYRDGITRIPVEGTGRPAPPGKRLVKAGEFILGYTDESGVLPDAPRPEGLGMNGSYLVYRRIYQDVARFRDFLTAEAEQVPQDEEWVAAKLMGRWRSGAPLTLAPDGDDELIAKDPGRNNLFDFAQTDPRGFLCPRGAHIRRANPRDELTDSTRLRHLVQRRGLPYGPPLPEGTPDDGRDRGLVGMMVAASIDRQFEFVQKAWLNNPNFNGLSNEHDPIAGHQDGSLDMTIQRRPIRKKFRDLPAFTQVKGSAYLFAPGRNGLAYLATN